MSSLVEESDFRLTGPPEIEVGPDEGRPEPRRALLRNFLVIAVALLLLKLLLVSQREMITEAFDAEAYVSLSLSDLGLVFGGDAYHPPGTSLVMALARSLGVPYRLFMEAFLALAAFLFLRPLVVSMRLGIAAAAIAYGLLLFHATLMPEMDRAMSDSVSFFLWLAGAGGIIGFVGAPRESFPWWSLGLAVASFAFAGITRSAEGAMVFVEMVGVALASILLFCGVDSWRRRPAIVACLCAVAANLGATQALSAAHFVTNGYWGATAVESRQWWQLYSTLLSIPVQRNNRHVLVNNATLETADSFSNDLRNTNECIHPKHSSEEIRNADVEWAITGCLPDVNSSKNYTIMSKISSDIIDGARLHHLQLLAPTLGIIPQPVVKWLWDLPSSVLRVGLDAIRLPGSTRVPQGSGDDPLFNRALLRRTALVATGENPEVVGYSFIRIPYFVLAALFWPSIPIVLLAATAIVIRSRRMATKSNFIVFAISVMIIDVLCRISFYSIVDWILWDLPPRYILGANVLTVVIVSMLLTVWLAPAAERVLGPKLMKLPRLGPGPKNAGVLTVAPDPRTSTAPHSAAAAASRFGGAP